MAEGQTKKDVIKKARKKPAEPPKTAQASTETPTSSEQPSAAFLDMYRGVRDQMAKEKETEAQQAVTDPAKLESASQDLASFRSGLGVLTEEGTPQPQKDTMLDEAYRRVEEREKQLKKRRGIAADLKSLSKRGALTGDRLKEARQKAEKAGVTGEQFESFMEKNRIRERGSPFSFKRQKSGTGLFDQPAPDPTEAEAAAQNVMFQRQYGTEPNAASKAMQDPNYVLGSGSPLNQPASRIGTASGKFRRAALRQRRRGNTAAAQQLALLGEMARMGEPSIDTPALRGRRMAQRMAAAEEARKQDKLAAENPLPAVNNQPDIKTPMAYVSPLEKTRNQ